MADKPSPEALIEALRRLHDEHGVRAESLLPDLVVVGLALDILDAGLTALELLGSDRPYRAYAMVRIAFEATQRLLVLCTSPNYVELGTRAWLYYKRKDTRLTKDPEPPLSPQDQQLIDLWLGYLPSAQHVVDQQMDQLVRLRGQDNFLGRDMAEAVDVAYAALAAELGSSVPEGSANTNRAIYRSLSRESHAAMRLEVAALHIDSDGFVRVDQRPRTRDQVAPPVRNALEVTLMEAIAAFRYRLVQRRRQHAQALAAQMQPEPSEVPPAYLPDFGNYLLEEGLGHVEAVFPHIPIQYINELKDGTLAVSVTSKTSADAHIATFDFKGQARDDLLTIMQSRFPEAVPALDGPPLRVRLPTPIFLTIRASLGRQQRTAKESFIPLIVNGFTVDQAA